MSELVRHNDTLEKLILSNNHIRDVGAGQLVAALSQNSSLKGLYLAGNTFGDSFSVRCSEVIGRRNNTLTTLDIRNTRLSRPAAQSVRSYPCEVRGANSPAGVRGANSPAGVRGANSPAGVRGANSSAGVRGANSPAGVRGANSPAGVRGANSPAGVRGANSPAGVTLY